MTEPQRRTYSRKYQSMIKRLEAAFIKPVYMALKKQVTTFTDAIETEGLAARNTISVAMINDHYYPVIRRLYRTAGMVNATMVRGQLKNEPVIKLKRLQRPDDILSFGTNDELTQEILNYLDKYVLNKSVIPVSETTREWVLREIEKGIINGDSPSIIAREIVAKVNDPNGFVQNQALRIVRTETVRATNVGAMKAAATSPFVVEKEWIAAHDRRTRHSHMRVDGTTADLDQKFGNGLMQPGDPEGPAKEIINCRCCIAVRGKRDENGMLIANNQRLIPSMI